LNYLKPLKVLPTHDVDNMPPYLEDQNLWLSDTSLREAVKREGADWAENSLNKLGSLMGRTTMFDHAEKANKNVPELKAFDRYGQRVNSIDYHPSYHFLLKTAIENEVPNFAWNNKQKGSQVAHMALTYIFNQVEGGVMCPMAMTYSVIPALKHNKEIEGEWLPKVLSKIYDDRDIPVNMKNGATIGMFMTEKQGGSDIRTNSTKAEPITSSKGNGKQYLLTGHKYFCSAPMCDAFLVLAYTNAGLSCFLVPRWKPDGDRNNLFIQRLKDKLGNRSNASSEIELQDTFGIMIGDEGKGVKTIIDMVIGNRVYCAVSSASLMRQAIVQVLHHTTHRTAFQKRLIDQPLMKNVIADMILESDAAVNLSMRVARAVDHQEENQDEQSIARICTTISKYWITKRAPYLIFEALECHGGPGYVEESILPRLYREAPLNSIWEGSGNVMCLDVLRALQKDKNAIPALFKELDKAKGMNSNFDFQVKKLKSLLLEPKDLEIRSRFITERLAVLLQASIFLKNYDEEIASAFCNSRLGSDWTGAFGTLPANTNFEKIIKRASG
jgi:putative acyl-CoA dehydrogenase